MQNFKTRGIERPAFSMSGAMLFFVTLMTLYLTLMTGLRAAGVEAILSNTEIVQGNMAQLKIKATGDRAEFPNIREIDGIPVLGRHESQNNSYTYINGKMSNERSTTLVLTFAPQKDMTVPSYEVKIDGQVYKTKPIDIKVRKASAPSMGGSSKFSLQLRTNKKTAIVGEPILATVFFSLKHGVRLSENPQYNKPEFKGFFVKEVGEEKSYNEADRQVTELRYILIPQEEGNFTVGPATANVAVADRNRRDMFGRFFGSTWVPIASNMVTVKVEAKPQESDLVGDFTLKSSIDAQKVKANKPVNLTVEISGEGSLEDFEFPAYEIDGVTVYSDDAKVTSNIESRAEGDVITSRYTKSFAFISDRDFTIPARSITAYDTKTKTLKTLEVPAYDIHIEGGSSAAAVPAAAHPGRAEKQAGKVQTNLKVVPKSMLDDGQPEMPVPTDKTEWWMVVLAFLSGMLVMFLGRYLPGFKPRAHIGSYSEEEALKILYPHMSDSAEIEEMVRLLYAKKGGDKSVVIDKKALNRMVEKVQAGMED